MLLSIWCNLIWPSAVRASAGSAAILGPLGPMDAPAHAGWVALSAGACFAGAATLGLYYVLTLPRRSRAASCGRPPGTEAVIDVDASAGEFYSQLMRAVRRHLAAGALPLAVSMTPRELGETGHGEGPAGLCYHAEQAEYAGLDVPADARRRDMECFHGLAGIRETEVGERVDGV